MAHSKIDAKRSDLCDDAMTHCMGRRVNACVQRVVGPQSPTQNQPTHKFREGASPRQKGPRSHIVRHVGSGPAKGELALAQILGLGLLDAGWPMQGNGAQ